MPNLYLLDIEGTTSPVSFVYDVLFPYARQRMKDYILAHAGEPALDSDLRLLAQENAIDRAAGAPIIYLSQPLSQDRAEALQSSVAYLLWLMDKDRKSTALKSIQGKIWAEGYEQGHLHSEIFPDVPAALERWHAAARIAIYSSGSVEAQKYLFRFTGAGDLTPLIDAWFDTHTGAKIESASYQKIAAAMNTEPAEILFISDSVRELDAARQAGMTTLLSVRPGNAPVSDSNSHPAIHSFDSL
jgi:enolase-phosphatase E1